MSTTCLSPNAEVLKADLSIVESVVLSHGHFDHFGAMAEFLKSAAKAISLFLHPDAFLERRLNIPGIGAVNLPALDDAALKKTRVMFHKVKEASTPASDLIMVSGEVQRVTDFEKGFPWAEARIDGKRVVNPFHDDEGIAVNVKNRGLVVIGGCSHTDIINTVKHFQNAALTSKIHAVLGGFHLTGPIFEPIIGPTIAEMIKSSTILSYPYIAQDGKISINLPRRCLDSSFLIL